MEGIGLAELFRRQGEPRLVVFAGRGGLGKTTCSAALAHFMATRRGRRTLCFSTDPQASLSDVFERDIFGRGVCPVAANLDALEVDVDRRVADRQRAVRERIRRLHGEADLPPEIEAYVDAAALEPAMAESAALDAMIELLRAPRHDLHVLDMPPFGDGARLLALAGTLLRWVDGIARARARVARYAAAAASLQGTVGPADEVLGELDDIRRGIREFLDLLADRRRTAFLMVVVPDGLAAAATERAVDRLRGLGVWVSGLVVNQVYPEAWLDRPGLPEFLRRRVAAQQTHVRRIREAFGGLVAAEVPVYAREPKGLAMLEQVADDLVRPA